MLERRKTSFLGEIIFIIILVIIVYLFLMQVKSTDLNKLEKINKKYGVTGEVLVPTNHLDYIAELNELKTKEYTTPIINYVILANDAKEITDSINLTILNDRNCISNKLHLKINLIVTKQKNVLNLFTKEENNKHFEKIYWDKYIEKLRSTTEFQDIKNELNAISVCKS